MKPTDRQMTRLRVIPPMYRGLFERCYQMKALRPQRIKAKCLDCCGYQRIEVANCTAETCPLWPIRPYQKDTDADEPEKDV